MTTSTSPSRSRSATSGAPPRIEPRIGFVIALLARPLEPFACRIAGPGSVCCGQPFSSRPSFRNAWTSPLPSPMTISCAPSSLRSTNTGADVPSASRSSGNPFSSAGSSWTKYCFWSSPTLPKESRTCTRTRKASRSGSDFDVGSDNAFGCQPSPAAIAAETMDVSIVASGPA